jgi:hypothetical protein
MVCMSGLALRAGSSATVTLDWFGAVHTGGLPVMEGGLSYQVLELAVSRTERRRPATATVNRAEPGFHLKMTFRNDCELWCFNIFLPDFLSCPTLEATRSKAFCIMFFLEDWESKYTGTQAQKYILCWNLPQFLGWVGTYYTEQYARVDKRAE